MGREHEAQGVVEQELKRLGFEVERLPIPDGIATDPLAGVPQLSYDGRFDVIGRSGAGQGPSLLLNGHIDVVPAEQPDRWASPPFEPRRDGDRLYGRGAGDMKGGFAMAILALDALRATAPDAIAGPLTFVSVIEEECTGNGTLAAARAGVLADAVILPEPTGLELLLAGVGILWLDVVITGRSAHAEAADRVVNPVDLAIRVVEALRDLEREMNADIEPSMDGVAHPYNINVGTFAAGDWPSSVPAIATLRLRVGHPTAWTADEAEARVRR
ncbi:MAG TPA: M20/M25/M40 family metallo-hydrolase, partial [Actinomycetota bacterium]